MLLIYQFLGEEPFEHDFDRVEYQEPEFDNKLKTQSLYQVRSQVEFKPRKMILLPGLFERFDGLYFWLEATNSRASTIVAKAK